MEIKERIRNILKNQKNNLMYAVFTLTAAIIIVVTVLLIKQRKISSVFLENTLDSNKTSLIAFDSSAKKGFIKQFGNAKFGFTESQKKLFSEISENSKTVSLIVRIKLEPTTSQKELLTASATIPFNYGIFYKNDIEGKNKYPKDLNSIISVYANLSKALSYSDTEGKVFDISIAIPKNNNFETNPPLGFFINSTVKCKILSSCVAPALLGYDNSTEVPFYGFASNGGIVDFQCTSFDFSGASLVFANQNTNEVILPEIEIKLSDNPEWKSDMSKKFSAKINVGGEKITIKNVKNANVLKLPCGSLSSPFSLVEFSENKDIITSFLIKNAEMTVNKEVPQGKNEVLSPIKTDPGMIIKYNKKNWRTDDYEIFEWDRFPGILFFDICDYDKQDKFFRRLAYFVEKTGYKGKLWSNEVLEGKHGYNAHDYSSESLAEFFNRATEDYFELYPEEELLKKILIYNELLIPDGKYVLPGNGGIVSISQESATYLRNQLIAHEGWHTLFFKNEDFRNFVAAVFYTMDYNSKQFLLDFFSSQPSLGYDITDDYLVTNEFMAYLLQQGVSEVANYYINKSNLPSVYNYTPDLCLYIRETNAKGLEDAAAILNDFVFDQYGIIGGDLGLVKNY